MTDELPGLELPGLELPPPRAGEAARLLEESIAAATKTKQLEAEHHGLIGAARTGAYALDQARTGTGPKVAYAVAAVLTPYREVLEALGLVPERVETPTADDALTFLQSLGPTPPAP